MREPVIPAPDAEVRQGEVRLLFPLLFGYCVAVIAVTAMYPIFALFTHVSNDFGEGWNAYWAKAVQSGLPLYSASRTFTANNYPPLSFYANAALGGLIGDNIFAGRLIALASMVGVAALIAWIVARLGAPRRWAGMAATLFLLYNLVYLRQMVAVDNPQWLGEMIGLASILPLISRPTPTLRNKDVIVAAAIMVSAGLVKHNQFALPLAVTLWLLLFDRRALLTWCLSGACFAGAACAVLYGLYGQAVFIEILHFQRTMSPTTFKSGLVKSGLFLPMIGVAAIPLYARRGDARLVLLLLYALFGVVFGILQRLGSGVYINAYDDALIGLVTVCGTSLGLAAAGRHRLPLGRSWRALLLVVLLAPIILVTPKHVRQSIADVRDLGRQEDIWKTMIATVRDARGPVLCELPSVCYWAGKPLVIDFFAYGQKLRLGADPAPFHDMVAKRRAAVIVVDRQVETPQADRRLPPPFPDLIDSGYRVVTQAANHVATMVPR